MICPFKAYAKEGDICDDCGTAYAPAMECDLTKVTSFIGAPITAGAASVCDPSSGVCESCE